MPAAELAEWMAFDRISPLPDRRADIHFAALTSAVLNGLGAKPEGGGRWQVEDWILFRPERLAEEADEATRRATVARSVLTQMRAFMANNQGPSDER